MKNIVLVADVFPPFTSSAAVQLHDLSLEFIRQGYRITVLIPDAELQNAWHLECIDGIEICRLRAPRTKNIGYIRRTINEALSPFFMIRGYHKCPLAKEKWDGIVWYSPTIFFGPLIKYLKKSSSCRSYLILRDIFPQWALDLGLMKKGLPYLFFKLMECFQYSVADVIGVQSKANLSYLKKIKLIKTPSIEVLNNWLRSSEDVGCSIDIASTELANRKIFVYAGNMGIAQGVMVFLDMAEMFKDLKGVGFVLVGRGKDLDLLRREIRIKKLTNILVYDEIPSSEIPGLYKQCDVGLVALDSRHKTHNIPGKFLSYMESGLPVLAKLNQGNDLLDLISSERVGYATSSESAIVLKALAEKLLERLSQGEQSDYSARCRAVMKQNFLPENAVTQIIGSLIHRL